MPPPKHVTTHILSNTHKERIKKMGQWGPYEDFISQFFAGREANTKYRSHAAKEGMRWWDSHWRNKRKGYHWTSLVLDPKVNTPTTSTSRTLSSNIHALGVVGLPWGPYERVLRHHWDSSLQNAKDPEKPSIAMQESLWWLAHWIRKQQGYNRTALPGAVSLTGHIGALSLIGRRKV